MQELLGLPLFNFENYFLNIDFFVVYSVCTIKWEVDILTVFPNNFVQLQCKVPLFLFFLCFLLFLTGTYIILQQSISGKHFTCCICSCRKQKQRKQTWGRIKTSKHSDLLLLIFLHCLLQQPFSCGRSANYLHSSWFFFRCKQQFNHFESHINFSLSCRSYPAVRLSPVFCSSCVIPHGDTGKRKANVQKELAKCGSRSFFDFTGQPFLFQTDHLL